MNCVFNGVLEKNYKIYKNIFIPPWSDDLGVGLGSSLLLNFKFKKSNKINNKSANVYLGPEYSNSEIEKYS